MRAQLTRLTCLSPGLAGLACPLCRSFGWPLLVHRDPCMQHRGHRRKAAREPMAIHSCVHLLWVHPLRYHLLELLLSFSPCILPPTLLLFFVLHCLLLLLLLFLCTKVMTPHPDPVSDLCSSGQEAACSPSDMLSCRSRRRPVGGVCVFLCDCPYSALHRFKL